MFLMCLNPKWSRPLESICRAIWKAVCVEALDLKTFFFPDRLYQVLGFHLDLLLDASFPHAEILQG